MDDLAFAEAKQRLDLEIDNLGAEPQVGILMGIDLYTEFRRRDLLSDPPARKPAVSVAHFLVEER
jgi:hypothetical protein